MRFGSSLARGVLYAVVALLFVCWLGGALGIDPKLVLGALFVVFALSGLGPVTKFLKKILVVVVVLMVLPMIVAGVLQSAKPIQLLAGLAVVSLCSYWIREWRLRKQGRLPKLRGAERTPVLPHREFES